MSVRILFVDDEPNVLQGLRRMFRPMRHEWDIHTAESGAEALSLLEQQPFDILVSDMRMPVMDGVELLGRVRDAHPQVARFVLSGFADDETILKTTTLAHQYLSKPCDPELLKGAVSRAVRLREVLRGDTVRSMTGRLRSLPTPPALYVELMRRLEDDRCSAEQIGELVRKDSAMTAKLLQIVNSSFFGLARRVVDAADAVRVLGFDMVKGLVLFAGVMPKREDADGRITQLSDHSLRVGILARRIVDQFGDPATRETDAPAAFTAGVLHDAGCMVLLGENRALYDGVIEQSRAQRRPLDEVEAEVLGADHAALGAHLLGLWGLPDEIVEAVLFHHAPSSSTGGRMGALAAVHIANVIDRSERAGPHTPPAGKLDEVFLTRCGVLSAVKAWWVPPSAGHGAA
jgi:Predicted signal transduction protein